LSRRDSGLRGAAAAFKSWWLGSPFPQRHVHVKRRANSFSGAVENRLTADWTLAQLRSASQEIRGDLKKLRARAREIGRNDAYGKRFLGLVEENVIGPWGIGLQARVRGFDDKPDKLINRTIEAAWHEWGKPKCASADRRLSWIGIQQLAVRTEAQDGEALVRMLPGFDNAYGFALQLLDPDQLDIDYNRPASRGVNEIRLGIEIDKWGAAVAYHCWSSHPSDSRFDRERIRIPADQMIHLFMVERPGQTRGVPWAAPVIISSRMLNGFQEAYLVACRVGASKMGFFSRKNDEEDDPDAPGNDGPLTMDASPGTFEDITGYDLHPWEPDYPAAGYPDFVKSQLRTQASGYGVSYNTLANDLEGVNYSSIRAGLITERDRWRLAQVHTIEHLHELIYPEWLKWSVTVGGLKLPSYDYREYLEHVWQPRGWQWVDPLKDALAAEKMLELGLDSRTRLAGEQGRDFEETLEELRHEKELSEEYGVPISPAPTASDAAFARALYDDDDEQPAKRNGNHRLVHAERN